MTFLVEIFEPILSNCLVCNVLFTQDTHIRHTKAGFGQKVGLNLEIEEEMYFLKTKVVETRSSEFLGGYSV